MDLQGRWRNQYGSLLLLRHKAEGALAGSFETALEDSIFFGQTLCISGVQVGDALAFSFGFDREGVEAVCSFTGRLESERLETVWHVVTTAKPWPHAIITNADTFERAH